MNVPDRRLFSAVAFVVIGGLAAPASAAPVDCLRPSGHEQERACAAAAKGVHELRQFIQRTRSVYILYIKEFEQAVTSVAAERDKADTTKLAGRQA